MYTYIFNTVHYSIDLCQLLQLLQKVWLFSCCPNCLPTIFRYFVADFLWHLPLREHAPAEKHTNTEETERILFVKAQFLERFWKSSQTHRILFRHCCQSSHRSCRTPGSEECSVHCHIWTLQEGRWVLACGTCAVAHQTRPHSHCHHHRRSHETHTGRSGRWTDVAGTPGRCSPAHRCCPRSHYVDHTWF